MASVRRREARVCRQEDLVDDLTALPDPDGEEMDSGSGNRDELRALAQLVEEDGPGPLELGVAREAEPPAQGPKRAEAVGPGQGQLLMFEPFQRLYRLPW